MSTFLVHEGMFVFGNLGECFVSKLYDAFCSRNSLPDNYFVCGAYKGLPYEGTIKKMDKITVNQSCELLVNNSGMLNYRMLVHPNQKFWLTSGYKCEEIRAKDINKPATKISSMNGVLSVESIGWINEPQTYYLIETGKLIRPSNDIMRSLYVSNLLLLPLEDEDIKDDLPFFIEEE